MAWLLLCVPLGVNAQTYGEEAARSIRAAERVEPLEDGMFGEQISLYNGSTKFRMVDVSLPSHNGLKVELARNIGGMDPSPNFWAWDIDVPKISTLLPDSWAGGWTPDPPEVVGHFRKNDYWQGFQLTTNGGTETLLYRGTDARIALPAMPGDFRFMTKSGWAMQVVPAASGVGSTVIGHAPDGTKYHFDHLVKFPYYGGSVQHRTKFNQGVPLVLSRQKMVLFVSRVEDRFGNWVRYEWTGAKLLRIHANDGREIVIASDKVLPQLPEAEDNRYILKEIAVNGRIWTYSWNPSGAGSEVVNPDGSTWNYQFSGGFGQPIDYQRFGPSQNSLLHDIIDCSKGYDFTPGQQHVLKIKHPSGALAEYRFVPMRHGRTNVPYACFQLSDNPDEWNNRLSTFDDVFSLVSKTVSGPGLPIKTTTYGYAGLVPAYAQNPFAPNDKDVTVTESDGSYKKLVFGRDWELNEGILFSTSEYSPQGALVRKTDNAYLTAGDIAAQPFPLAVGSSRVSLSGNFSSQNLPLRSRVIQQEGTTFTSYVEAYDQLANPARVRRYSSLGYSTTDSTEYESNLSLWVLSQVKRRTNVNSNLVMSQVDYDPTSALPIRTYAFNKLQHTLTYNTTPGSDQTGTLATVTDGNNNTVTLSQWKRGIPQLIQHPATPDQPGGVSQSAAVDDHGWIRSVTDENGYTTGYDYDPMGRLKRIDYPTGDSTAWHSTHLSFAPSASPVYGLPAGHWQQTVTTGNALTVTVFDALWRPVVKESRDVTDVNGTLTQTVIRYDASGRTSFVSYPQRSLDPAVYNTWANPAVTPNALGVRTEYDALDRVTAVRQDSEQGVLSTTTEYLPNLFWTRVTNLRGQVTDTSYMAFDQPTYDWPVGINHPEGANTEIGRDVFGKPRSLTRRNNDGSLSVTRRYVYRPDWQTLCKTIEPETGATVMDYDAAGNLGWSASGLSLPSTSDCNLGEAYASGRRVDRNYDARNRLKTLRFPDTRGDQDWSYTPDGLPSSVTTVNVPGAVHPINQYLYNKRRMLESETQHLPAWYSYSLGYRYTRNGHLDRITYPSSDFVDFAPNALGQATQAIGAGQTYASNVSYYPNGAIAGFSYGNGIVHTMIQNARQLPVWVGSAGVSNDEYHYDANGNVSFIGDWRRGHPGHRWMEYDGLDRLTAAGSVSFGGDHWHRFTYDTLDNLKTWTLGGVRDHRYCYNDNNRLEFIRSGASSCSDGAAATYLAYDGQGNVQQKNGQAFDFDTGNRLREVIDVERYRYDAHGRRILAMTFASGVIFSQYGQSGQLLYQSNTRTGQNKQIDHIYLAGSLIAQREVPIGGGAVTVKYQHTDALGSPVAVTDQNRNVIERFEYEPYGKVINSTPKDGPGYTGHVLDAATGMNYMQQRYYWPEGGIFLSVDPVSVDTITGWNFCRYCYANNNPYRFTDPDGRIPVETVWDAANVGMGGVSLARNMALGNYVGAAVDVIGIVIDGAATATPYVPGGAATAIKAARSGDLVGNAQRTYRAGKEATGHGFASARQALQMMRSGSYEKVFLNREIGTITGGGIKSGLRPDVAGLRPDGKIDITEVLSPRQNAEVLQAKYAGALGDRMGEFNTVRPTKVPCIGSRIAQTSC